MVKLAKISPHVLKIISVLRNKNYEAFVVGGCVRDTFLGSEPKDWDIATAALPNQIIECFDGHRVITTGIKHGTVTVVIGDEPFEITTYRVDGEYSDSRRPDSVSFSQSITNDLARRDFTINAMAWNPERGLVDPFGGQADLAAGILHCVGNPEKRFKEDALRIMRCVRFAAVLGFAVEENAEKAMLALCERLDLVARERVRTELLSALAGKNFRNVFMKYPQILFAVIPELAASENFAHNSPYHIYDVYEHTLRAVEYAPPEPLLRMALLLHDIGKPAAYTQDADGTGHFKGHPLLSAEIADAVLKRLRFSAVECHKITTLVKYHDKNIKADRAEIKRWLGLLGAELFGELVSVKIADAQARAKIPAQKRLQEAITLGNIAEDIIANGECYQIAALAVSGSDLIKAGIPEGRAVGEMLQQLLDEVINGGLENNQAMLLERVRQLQQN